MSQPKCTQGGDDAALPRTDSDSLPVPKSEEALQAMWADFLAVTLPVDAVHHHSPNEGRRGWRAQRALKSSGCAAGWPDSEIVYDGRVYFLELKLPGKKPTKLQSERHEQLRRAGAPVGVGTSLAELAAHLVEWGVPLRISAAEYARLRTAGRMTAAQYRAMQPTPKPTVTTLVLKPARKPKFGITTRKPRR